VAKPREHDRLDAAGAEGRAQELVLAARDVGDDAGRGDDRDDRAQTASLCGTSSAWTERRTSSRRSAGIGIRRSVLCREMSSRVAAGAVPGSGTNMIIQRAATFPLTKTWQLDAEFAPEGGEDRNRLYEGWAKAVERSRAWAR